MDTGETIWIESTRDKGGLGAACLFRWGAVERYVPVADVRQTAEDLFILAAYAELIEELLQVGLDGQLIQAMMTGMLSQRQPRYFGRPNTVFLMCGGSSTRKKGVVMLGRRDLFHQGKADVSISPDKARAMGRVWLTSAEAAEADTLFGAVLDRSGWLGGEELDALFALVGDIRVGNAELPPSREGG